MTSSLPSRERGLKFPIWRYVNQDHFVAPLAGAWIEMAFFTDSATEVLCRSPRGSVD